jgi:lipid-A-disaccharide synthase
MSPSILFSTGEVSGDVIGALLARELKAKCPELRLWGVGGGRMRAAGVRILADGNPLGSAGITEPLKTLPAVFKSFVSILTGVHQERPDAAVLIGHEVFNLILSRWLRRKGILTIAYFPPQIWIWRKATPLIARCYDYILTSFIEEDAVYRRAGGRTVFVGHYLLDLLKEVSPEEKGAARQALGLTQQHRIIGILPGSRLQEVTMLGPIFLDSAAQMATRDPSLRFVLPVADPCLEEGLTRLIRHRRLEQSVFLNRDSQKSLAASDLVILCSGTATLEAALMKLPMVIVYRVSRITIMVVRLLVMTKLMDSETVGLPNLLSGESMVVELRQADAHPSKVADAAWRLLTDEIEQSRPQNALQRLTTLLGPTGAMKRAAQAILERSRGVAPSGQRPEDR